MKTAKKSVPRKRSAPLTVTRPELLVDGSDDQFRRLVHGLLAFLAVHSSVRDGYASWIGLSGPEYTIMLCIRHLAADGPVNIRTVADHLRLSGSFVTIETNKLEQAGLLEKGRQKADRRMVALCLTAKGNALLDGISNVRRQVNNVQFGDLTKEEFRALVPLVDRLIASGERALSLLAFLREHGQNAVLVSEGTAKDRGR